MSSFLGGGGGGSSGGGLTLQVTPISGSGSLSALLQGSGILLDNNGILDEATLQQLVEAIQEFTTVAVQTLILNASQIRTLHSIPIQIIGPPGAGNFIVPLATIYKLSMGAFPFAPSIASTPADMTVDIAIKTGPSSFVLFQANQSSILAGLSNNAPKYPFLNANRIYVKTGFDTSPVNLGDPAAVENAGMYMYSSTDWTYSDRIAGASLVSGGLGYAPGDTGTILDDIVQSAVGYIVNTVGGGGAVLTFTITPPDTTAGNNESVFNPANVANTHATSPLTGSGDGNFTVNNLTGLVQGDGTLTCSIVYQIINLP